MSECPYSGKSDKTQDATLSIELEMCLYCGKNVKIIPEPKLSLWEQGARMDYESKKKAINEVIRDKKPKL